VPPPDRVIPIAKPWLGEREADAVRRPLASGWVSQGPEVAAFEREFASYVGASHAAAVSSCTAALHLALLAVGVKRDDEVITVSHSFIATANAIRHCGARPVFVDIDPATFNIDPARIEEAITPRTSAILCVHQMGMPCDLASILPIARSRSLPVVEDAACAAGSEIRLEGRWERIGRPRGDIACFSFHARKVLTTGDGGMLTTRDKKHDDLFRLWRQHGMSVSDTARHAASEVIFEEYPELGYNYRMTDIQAAVGRVQLARLEEMVATRRRLAARYRELLAGVPGIVLPVEPAYARSNWQSYCVRLPVGTDQRKVMQRMLDMGVATRRGIMCSHLEGAYAGRPGAAGYLAESERARDQGLLLPLYHDLTEADQDRVASALSEACRDSGSPR